MLRVRNQAATSHRNWPLGRMASGPWDSFFAAATLGGDRNLVRPDRVQLIGGISVFQDECQSFEAASEEF